MSETGPDPRGVQARPADEPSEGESRPPALPPVAYPLLGLVFGGILVFSFSRVLLAVKKDYAPAIGLLMSLNILVGAALVAYGGRVRRRPASFPLLLAAALGVIAIGVLALTLKEKPVEAGGAEKAKAETVTLVAQNTAFDPTSLSFTAGAKVSVKFENKDSGVPHNFALYADEAATQVVFKGDIVTGVTTTTYTFTAPSSPGTFYFHCDVHPAQMKGTVTVAAGGGGGTEAGGGLSLVAKGTAFQETELSAKGGGQLTIHFDNQDAGIPHNFVVFDGSDATAPVVFRGEIVTGPAKKDYTFTAPPPGTYFFHCDVHPQQMTGTLVVK